MHSKAPLPLRLAAIGGLVFLLAIPVFEMIDFAQILGVLNVFMRLP